MAAVRAGHADVGGSARRRQSEGAGRRSATSVVTLAAPFSAAPAELARTEFRFGNAAVDTDKGVGAAHRERPHEALDAHLGDRYRPGAAPRKLWDRSAEDSYGNPGTPIRREGASGLDGDRANRRRPSTSPATRRLTAGREAVSWTRSNLTTLDRRTRKYQMTEGFEPVRRVCSTDDGSRVLTRFETKNTPPATLVRSIADGRRVTLTTSADPAPAISSGAQKQVITYARADGVQLSATLYTPAGWTPDKGRLPMMLLGLSA